MTLHRRCRHTGGWAAALCLTLMATASMAHAAPDLAQLAPGATHATLVAHPLRPRDVVKTPPLPTRRPAEDSASLALLLGGLVVLWRAAERRDSHGHTP